MCTHGGQWRKLPRRLFSLLSPRKHSMTDTEHQRPVPTQAVGLVISLLVCFAAGGIGGLATTQGLDDWYDTLNKPTWNPPSWIFAPVWTTLYGLMGIAVWLVWLGSETQEAKPAISWFVTQLVLNGLWSVLFFGLQTPGGALIEIVFLWLSIIATTVLFFRHSKIAGGLMTPYLLWVGFAAFLNFTIWNLNRV